jgi:DNA-binding FadR family transcriptional regulator
MSENSENLVAPRPPARRRRLPEELQRSLTGYVRDNGLRPGDRLPPEADLAEALGVGRSSIREAIRGLESLGALETRHGKGVFVGAFTLAPLIEQIGRGIGAELRDFTEVLDVRCTLEVALIGRAMAAIRPRDVAALAGIVGAMERKARAGESFAPEDQAFHATLFAPLGNRVLLNLLDVFWQVFTRTARVMQRPEADPLATYRDHKALLDAVASGDVAAARVRLDAHYDGIRAVLLANRNKT